MRITVCCRTLFKAAAEISLSFFIAGYLFLSTAVALPVYTDSLQLTVEIPRQSNHDAQNRADQIRKLTDYIQETFRINKNNAVAIITEAVYNGTKHELQPELILAIIAVESSYQEKAISRAGARGLMQIMPRAHPKKIKEIGGIRALFDPKKNISTGVKILNEYLVKSEGDISKALLRYNGSSDPRSPYAKKVIGIFKKLKKIADLS